VEEFLVESRKVSDSTVLHQLFTVICRDQEQRVVGQSLGLEPLDETADFVIHEPDRRVVRVDEQLEVGVSHRLWVLRSLIPDVADDAPVRGTGVCELIEVPLRRAVWGVDIHVVCPHEKRRLSLQIEPR